MNSTLTRGCGFTFVYGIMYQPAFHSSSLCFFRYLLESQTSYGTTSVRLTQIKRMRSSESLLTIKVCGVSQEPFLPRWLAAEKELLCCRKAEFGASRGECFHSVQNNSWLPEQPWKASVFFFFSLSLPCPAATQTHSCAETFRPVEQQYDTCKCFLMELPPCFGLQRREEHPD